MLLRRALPAAFLWQRGCLAVSAPKVVPAAAGVRFATSKAGGSTKNGRDSNPKYLGVKKFGGERVQPGDIILRQRGQKYGIVRSTQTVGLGRDHTIYALVPGFVKFWWHGVKKKNYVEVVLAPTPPGQGKGSGIAQPIVPADCKYPIVRVKPWELPGLLALPPDTRISEPVRAQLLEYVRGLNPFQRAAVVPRGRPLIGGIDRLLPGPATGGGQLSQGSVSSTRGQSRSEPPPAGAATEAATSIAAARATGGGVAATSEAQAAPR